MEKKVTKEVRRKQQQQRRQQLRAVRGEGGDMKRSPSEIALEEFLITNQDSTSSVETNQSQRGRDVGLFGAYHFDSKNQDITDCFPSACGLSESLLWNNNNLAPRHSSISTTIDSQSSICAGSPMSENKPKGRANQLRVVTSGSEQSDDDDIETEAGTCEQSNDVITDIKRIRRMVSNRESARRSRRRKQAHLADLESQVDQLRGENASLFKQLTGAAHQVKDAVTNNRVLKSDVEALRANVKLAEDMVARGSVTSSLNHLLHLTSPQTLSSHSLRQVANVSPSITVRGDDSTYGGMAVTGQNSSLENADRIINDALSCVTELWPLESHVSVVSK